MKYMKRGAGIFIFTLTVVGSTAVAVSTNVCTLTPQVTAGPSSVSELRVKATSSALNGVPSLQVTPSRRWMVSSVKSSLYSQDSASQGMVSSEGAIERKWLVQDPQTVLVA